MRKPLFYAFLVFLLTTCQSKEQKFDFILLQLNDVYEIAALENGKSGGLARVARLRQDLLLENPNTITVLAGDFVSPSLIGTLKDSTGKGIKGKQVVETFNVLGLDYATFGNHEFDIDSASLQNRLDESTFVWTSANVFQKNGQVFKQKNTPCPTHILRELVDKDGKKLRLAIFGLTLPFNQADFVSYKNFKETGKTMYDKLQKEADIVVGLTHLSMAEDQELAAYLKGLPLIMGGHEHIAQTAQVGQTFIAKADANAKTVYIHRVSVDLNTKKVSIKSELKKIDPSIEDEPKTAQVVQKWVDFAHQSMVKMDFSPENEICQLAEPLDGRELTIRYKDCNLGKMIAQSFWKAMPQAQAAFFNSGSVRIDDQLHDHVTEYDIFRVLPYGGSLVLLKIKGTDLVKTLQIGRNTNVGIGGFLQLANFSQKDKQWFIGEKPINAEEEYKIAVPEFLALGKEANLDFLKDIANEKPEQLNNNLPNDLRKALIDFMKSKN